MKNPYPFRGLFIRILCLIFILVGCKDKTESAALEKEVIDFNISNEEDVLNAYVKMVGTTEEAQVYLQYYGEIVAVIPGEVEQKLFRLKGLVRQQWTPNEDGSFTYSNYDHGLFCDWETGKVLETYYTNLIMKCRIANEVAFLFYAAVSDFHSLSYENYKQENRTENEQV